MFLMTRIKTGYKLPGDCSDPDGTSRSAFGSWVPFLLLDTLLLSAVGLLLFSVSVDASSLFLVIILSSLSSEIT